MTGTPEVTNTAGGLQDPLLGDGLFKLGYVTNDRETAIERLQAQLGIAKFVTVEPSLEARAADGRTGTLDLRMAAWGGEHLVIEILQPAGGLDEFLTASLSGGSEFQLVFHHYGVLVDDLDAVKADARARGLEPVLESIGDGPLGFTFTDVPVLGQCIQHLQRSPMILGLIDQIRSGNAPPAEV